MEQAAVTATALQESLVQDYDGLIRIAPATPPGWDFARTVFVRGNTKVDVETDAGVVTTAVIETGSKERVRLRNPWPGEAFNVTDANSGITLSA
jgi:alpha-L-fucosidase 2